MKPRTSIFNPLGQRVYGMVFIGQGIATVIAGKHAPGLSLRVAMWGAQESDKLRRNETKSLAAKLLLSKNFERFENEAKAEKE